MNKKKLTEQIQKIFNSNFDLENYITRIPASISTDGNSITMFDISDLNENFILNNPTTGSIKSVTNKIKNNKSAIQRSLISYVSAEQMTQNKTYALQTLVLYFNNALIELTNALGSSIVTDKSNKIFVSFLHMEQYAAIEMRVKLLLSKE